MPDHNGCPNILLITTDQQRWDTVGALGNSIIKTPALDRLVREGTAFTACYTPSPVCGAPAHLHHSAWIAVTERLAFTP